MFAAASAVGCWFHYAQSLIKCTNKIGLKDVYGRDADVKMIVHCLMSLPLLLLADITDAVADIQEHVNDDNPSGKPASPAHQLRAAVPQWTNKRSIGPERLSVYMLCVLLVGALFKCHVKYHAPSYGVLSTPSVTFLYCLKTSNILFTIG